MNGNARIVGGGITEMKRVVVKVVNTETTMDKKINKRAKGNRNLKKAIDYFQGRGYKTEKLEVLKTAWIAGKIISVRTDILQSDLAVWDDKEFILCQVKSNKNDVRVGVEKYRELGFPPSVKKIVFLFEPRKKDPTIREVV